MLGCRWNSSAGFGKSGNYTKRIEDGEVGFDGLLLHDGVK
jgi:hypothetical protein